MKRGWRISAAEKHDENVPLLWMDRVSVRYGDTAALEDVSFSVEKGEQVAVVGPNGAGKSTLFKIIAGVLDPSEGVVKIGGSGPRGHVCVAYLPQRNDVDWTFPVTVEDVVAMGRVRRIGWFHRAAARDRRIVADCLATVGLSDLATRQIGMLSGGQQQRMFIARALAQEAELMLMDEPLSGLDLPSQEEIFGVLEKLKTRGVTIMIAMHDLSLAERNFRRVFLLNRRLLGDGAPREVFVPERLMEAYGGHLRMVRDESGALVVSDTCCGGGITP